MDHVALAVKEAYQELQKSYGYSVGDRVKIVRALPYSGRKFGWNVHWSDSMSKYVNDGIEYQIIKIGEHGLELNTSTNFWFPVFCVEAGKPNPKPEVIKLLNGRSATIQENASVFINGSTYLCIKELAQITEACYKQLNKSKAIEEYIPAGYSVSVLGKIRREMKTGERILAKGEILESDDELARTSDGHRNPTCYTGTAVGTEQTNFIYIRGNGK